MKRKIRAVLFDMDGLMFDTERLGEKVWIDIGKKHGYPVTAEHVSMIRGGNHENARRVFTGIFGADMPYDEISEDVWNELYRRMEKEIPVRPGLFVLLDELARRKVKMAVASSTRRDRVLRNLKQTDTEKLFSAVVCGNEVEHSKPAPDIFLKAAERVGVPPEECMVLEDSYNGVRAGAAAGCYTVMIPDMNAPTPEMEHLADAILPSLADVVELLAELD